MIEYTTKSGADLTINIAPFRDVMNLKNEIQKTIKKEDLANFAELDIEKLKQGNAKDIFSGITNAILAVDSSDEVYKAIFKCLLRCTYKGEKITETTFEDVDARSDYYEIVFLCVKENLAPFFKNALSMLPSIKSLTTQKSQEQK